MAVTADSMRLRFPFLGRGIEDATIELAIERATAEHVGDYGNTEELIHLLAAHKACLGPSGIRAKLVDKTGRSTFLSEYERLIERASFGFLVGDTGTLL